MDLMALLKTLVDEEGSDLYLTTAAPPCIKVHGQLKPIAKKPFAPGDVRELAYQLLSKEQIETFERTQEMNLGLAESNIGRFRVNIFQQRNEVGVVIRNIKIEIPTMEELHLPQALTKLIMQKRGLILFVGATGSGKSTSIASLIDHRNASTAGHIITIEDPIEYVYNHKKSIVNQREVGIDTHTYMDALQNALRQAPDVIVIGEIRSQETMEHGIAFAETGHLCVSTLHANNANQALDRIINFFPDERHKQLFLDLSLNLRGIVSQRLIPTIDGTRTVAVEVMLNSPLIADLIKKGEVGEIKEVMEKSEHLGMQTFDGALFKLYKDGTISLEEALRNADSANNLRLRISLDEGSPEDLKNSSLKLQNEDKKKQKKGRTNMQSSSGGDIPPLELD